MIQILRLEVKLHKIFNKGFIFVGWCDMFKLYIITNIVFQNLQMVAVICNHNKMHMFCCCIFCTISAQRDR